MREEVKDLRERTKCFAVEALRFGGSLPHGIEFQTIRRQLVRAATSVEANYRAACRARSKKEFIARLGVVVEEGDEVQYWMELLDELRGFPDPISRKLGREAGELVANMVASIKTASSNDECRMMIADWVPPQDK